MRRLVWPLLIVMLALGALVRPAPAHARSGATAVVAAHAQVHASALRPEDRPADERSSAKQGAPALPPAFFASIAPASFVTLAPPGGVAPSAPSLPSPAPSARGPPPSA